VAFATEGDELIVQVGNTISVTTEGPEAGAVPADLNNLVLQVAKLFNDMPGASFLLTKNLPVASGIGGGSADAAASFRALMTHWSGGEVDLELYDPTRTPMAGRLVELGADIPMCLQSRTARVTGIGEIISPLPLPVLNAVLVNPRVPVSTPEVFRALAKRQNAPVSELPTFRGPMHLVDWLAHQRNDLQMAAMGLCPKIGQTLGAIGATEGCLLERMSGSGATCFGLYETADAARAAADTLRAQHPDWWIASTKLGDMSRAILPRVTRRTS